MFEPMNPAGVTLDHYREHGDGFGSASLDEVAELNKALSAGEIRGSASTGQPGDGSALKVESLESTLKNVTYRAQNAVLWGDIDKLPAYNTVEEYNRLESYGSDGGAFNAEGELPNEEDSTYTRQAQLVKFMGNTRVITHPMTLVRTAHGDVMAREATNGTLWIVRAVDRALFFGDSAVLPKEFDGYIKQQRDSFATLEAWQASEQVIDLRGQPLEEGHLEKASEIITANFGFPSDLYLSTGAASDLNHVFYPRERFNNPLPVNGQAGLNITSFTTGAGIIKMRPDVFLKPSAGRAYNAAAISSKAPAKPTKDGVTPIAVVNNATNSRFVTGDAGNYFYAVSAINKNGESQLEVLKTTATAVVANDGIDLKFTDGAGTYATDGYRIYRSAKGAASYQTTYYPLFDVSTTQLAAGYDGGAAGLIRDLNRYLPSTSKALFLQRDTEVVSFKQLAPLMKMDLAILAPAYRFMVLLYGTPQLYAPKKMVTFLNIGRRSVATVPYIT